MLKKYEGYTPLKIFHNPVAVYRGSYNYLPIEIRKWTQELNVQVNLSSYRDSIPHTIACRSVTSYWPKTLIQCQGGNHVYTWRLPPCDVIIAISWQYKRLVGSYHKVSRFVILRDLDIEEIISYHRKNTENLKTNFLFQLDIYLTFITHTSTP